MCILDEESPYMHPQETLRQTHHLNDELDLLYV